MALVGPPAARGGFLRTRIFSRTAASGTIPGPMTLIRTQSKPSDEPGSGPAEAGRRVHVVTFGCQMNKYDSLLAEGQFRRAGWQVAGTIEEADVVLFNTCAVRAPVPY